MVIILLILITQSLDFVWILLGENCCWSLLALKGFKSYKLTGASPVTIPEATAGSVLAPISSFLKWRFGLVKYMLGQLSPFSLAFSQLLYFSTLRTRPAGRRKNFHHHMSSGSIHTSLLPFDGQVDHVTWNQVRTR